jgi:hypothetical protein
MNFIKKKVGERVFLDQPFFRLESNNYMEFRVSAGVQRH